MATKCLTTTVELPFDKDAARREMYARFDVPMDVRPVGEVFGDGDRALGTQNTLSHNSRALNPLKEKYADVMVTRNQVPAQMVALLGPFDGAEALARCWINHGNALVEGELRDCEKACLIDQAVEKYTFQMFVGEGAALDAITSELGWTPEERTLEQQIDDETRGGEHDGKVDHAFENGNTVQVKVGRAKFEGCSHKAKVTPNGDGTAKVEVWEK